jgi:hypothetical protein
VKSISLGADQGRKHTPRPGWATLGSADQNFAGPSGRRWEGGPKANVAGWSPNGRPEDPEQGEYCMLTDRYDLVLTGKIMPGEELEDVKQRLAKLLRVDAARVENMLSQAPVVVKKDLTPEDASRYQTALVAKTGAEAVLRQQGEGTALGDAENESKPDVRPSAESQMPGPAVGTGSEQDPVGSVPHEGGLQPVPTRSPSLTDSKIEQLERTIATLTTRLSEAKAGVTQWTEVNRSLSISAAEARAKNQGMGRGFLGGLLGPKYRRVVRAGATASNAAIAKEVARKRAQIVEGKRQSQERVREIQAELTAAKQELKALTSMSKGKASAKVATGRATSQSLALLQKLKEARDAGLLTEDEFEEKRKKLVSDLLD